MHQMETFVITMNFIYLYMTHPGYILLMLIDHFDCNNSINQINQVDPISSGVGIDFFLDLYTRIDHIDPVDLHNCTHGSI